MKKTKNEKDGAFVNNERRPKTPNCHSFVPMESGFFLTGGFMFPKSTSAAFSLDRECPFYYVYFSTWFTEIATSLITFASKTHVCGEEEKTF